MGGPEFCRDGFSGGFVEDGGGPGGGVTPAVGSGLLRELAAFSVPIPSDFLAKSTARWCLLMARAN